MPAKPPSAQRDRRPASQRAKNTRRPSRHRRPPWWQSPAVLGGGALAVVVVAVVAIVVVNQAGGQSKAGNTGRGNAVPSAVLSAVAQPSAAELAQIGSGSQPGNLAVLPSPRLIDSAGKPVVIYAGAEYCPFCAAERWVIVAALSRFGSFSGLQETTSSATDAYPNTSTFTFLNARYTSEWVDFQSAELEDRNRQPLQSPSAQVASAFAAYDQPPYTSTTGAFPFLDIAGRWTLNATSYSPQLLQGLSWNQIATDLQDPTSPVAQAIFGNANILTAAICSAPGKPGSMGRSNTSCC